MSKNKFKNALNVSLLVVFAICTSLFLAEIIVRYALPSYGKIVKLYQYLESEKGKFARYDYMLGWHGRENGEDDFEWVDTHHHVRQNRFGYRGRDIEYKRTHKRRIMVLGDSFVWGFGVEEKDIFSNIMDLKSDNSVEIINMGVSGYGNDQEYLLWKEEGHWWKPDDVIIMVTIYTDYWDNLSPNRYGYPKPVFQMDEQGELILTNTPVPERSKVWADPKQQFRIKQATWIQKLCAHSAVANLVLTAALKSASARNFLEAYKVIPKREPGFDWEYPLYLVGSDEETEKPWTIMFKIFKKLDSDVKAKRGRLWVAIIPSVVQVYPELWEKFRASPSVPAGLHLDPLAPGRRITEWCRNNNIQVIDLLPELMEAGKSKPYLYYPINRHWTSDGHEVVADILLDELGILE